MDEAFWSGVLKRWSDASENVIYLKKELAKLQEEKASHVCPKTGVSANTTPIPQWTFTPKDRVAEQERVHIEADVTQNELKHAEIGLGKAKEEYRKLLHELALSSKVVDELRLQNKRLTDEHQQEIRKLLEERRGDDTPKQSYKSIELVNKVAERTSHDSAAATDNSNDLVADLKQQICLLTKALEVSKTERRQTHHELVLTREKLSKAEENINILLSSIVKLQVIARHPSHPSSRFVPDKLLQYNSRKTSKISIRSGQSQIVPTTQISQPQPYVEITRLPVPPLQVDKQSVEITLPSGANLPPARRKTISKLPSVKVSPTFISDDNIFDRPFLKHILGDGVQSLLQNFPLGSDSVDKKMLVSSYLCPTLDHHPWCPSTPGQHGFIFVNLEKEKGKSSELLATRNIFVGLPKIHGKARFFRYVGKYRVTQVDDMTCDEWETLSEEIKFLYAAVIPSKAQDPRSADEILSTYNTGEKRLPCVQLQCIGFDEQFFIALVKSKKSKL